MRPAGQAATWVLYWVTYWVIHWVIYWVILGNILGNIIFLVILGIYWIIYWVILDNVLSYTGILCKYTDFLNGKLKISASWSWCSMQPSSVRPSPHCFPVMSSVTTLTSETRFPLSFRGSGWEKYIYSSCVHGITWGHIITWDHVITWGYMMLVQFTWQINIIIRTILSPSRGWRSVMLPCLPTGWDAEC